MNDIWRQDLPELVKCQLTRSWLQQAGLFEAERFATISKLNHIASIHTTHQQQLAYQFIAQEAESDYYESVIDKHKQIPTRINNWHDFFNACIWMQFPKAKALISHLHATDITANGLHPRSAQRNRLTHFDECGILLLCDESRLDAINPMLKALATHQWLEVFVKNRELWHAAVCPVIFGHAILEMLLSPFIGLTAKWLALPVPTVFFQQTPAQQRAQADCAVYKHLNSETGFVNSDALRPLPVLGVPNWHAGQDEKFYANTEYFRRQRASVPLSAQLPLTAQLAEDDE